MPTYIFKDKKTDEVFEIVMKISELDDYKLNNPKFSQLPTAPNFRLKGTGWYETDFKTGSKKNIAKSDNEKQNTSTAKDTKDTKDTKNTKDTKDTKEKTPKL